MSDDISNLLTEIIPKRRIHDLVIPAPIQNDINDLIREHEKIDLLRSHSLEPRHTILMTGPPGTGKTSLAEAMASSLGLPLYLARYDTIIDSYLGETASRIRRILDFAGTTPCVLFFDEFDAIGKERGDVHETGEIKRVVSSLLVQLDALPPHVITICATNHPELLDRAVWRRFELQIELPLPTKEQICQWFYQFKIDVGAGSDVDPAKISKKFIGVSFADLESFTLDVRRRRLLSDVPISWAEAIDRTLARWSHRLKPNKRTNAKNAPTVSNSSPDLLAEDGQNSGAA